MTESFTTTNRFFDSEHYPHGFSRHGDFTIKEAKILERYGYAFNELNLGRRKPVTEEERNFVAVCLGKCKPVTEAERVWIKYMTCIKRPKRFHTLSGGKLNIESVEDYNDTED